MFNLLIINVMSKLNKMPDYQAKLPRYMHDVSRTISFTSSSGHLLPVWYDLCSPGEKYQLKTSLFMRSRNISTAAMASAKVNVDYFFVPLTMVYTPFQQLFYEVDDRYSSNFYDSTGATAAGGALPNGNLPLFNFNNYYLGQGIPEFRENEFECQGMQWYRLLWHLGYNPNCIFYGLPEHDIDAVASCYSPNVFPLTALVYQAIYYNYYRLEDYESNDPRMFNFDRYYTSPLVSSTTMFENLFRLHYRPRPKDYFTSLKVNPISGTKSLFAKFVQNDGDGQGINDPLRILAMNNSYLYGGAAHDSFDNPTVPEVGAYPKNKGAQPTDNDNNYHPDINFISNYKDAQADTTSTSQIRQLFAVEKLARITGRSQKNYDSQTLAHFGVHVPKDVMHNLSYLGTHECDLTISEVVALAGTESDALGELGGKGTGLMRGQKTISFTVPCHGMIMAIYSVSVKPRYFAGVDKSVMLRNRLDFPIPEFDRLGMQPLFAYENCYQVPTLDENGKVASVTGNKMLGWQYRYEQYKRKFDVISPAFADVDDSVPGMVSPLSPWFLSRQPFGNITMLTGSNSDLDYSNIDSVALQQSPYDLNNILSVPFTGQWDAGTMYENPRLIFALDPLIVDLHVEAHKLSHMSVYGEPELD